MTSFASSRNFGFDIDMDMDLIELSKKRGEHLMEKFELRTFSLGNLQRRKILEKRQKENFIDRHFSPLACTQKISPYILHTFLIVDVHDNAVSLPQQNFLYEIRVT